MDVSTLYREQSLNMNNLDKEEFALRRGLAKNAKFVKGYESITRQYSETGYVTFGPIEGNAASQIKSPNGLLDIHKDSLRFIEEGAWITHNKCRELVKEIRGFLSTNTTDHVPLKYHALVLEKAMYRLGILSEITDPTRLRTYEIIFNEDDYSLIKRSPDVLRKQIKRLKRKKRKTVANQEEFLKIPAYALFLSEEFTQQERLCFDTSILTNAKKGHNKDDQLFDFILKTSAENIRLRIGEYKAFMSEIRSILPDIPNVAELEPTLDLPDVKHKKFNTAKQVIELCYRLGDIENTIMLNMSSLEVYLPALRYPSCDIADRELVYIYCYISYLQASLLIVLKNLIKKLQSVVWLQLLRIEGIKYEQMEEKVL